MDSAQKLYGFGRGRFAVWDVDQLEFADFEPVLASGRGNFCRWTDKDWNDYSCFCGLGDTTQRSFVAGMRHDRYCSRDAFCPRYQAVIFRSRRLCQRSEGPNFPDLAVSRRGHRAAPGLIAGNDASRLTGTRSSTARLA